MRTPLVTVIIPSYDRPVLLRTRSIPSVLRQSYENWNLIVVGEGPTDDSLQRVVASFRDPRMAYVEIPRPDYSQLSRDHFWKVAGSTARNYGLGLATGDVIAPLDDDDEFIEDHLSDCLHIIDSGEADCVYGAVIVRNLETGEEHEDLFPWSDPGNRALFDRRNILYHSSVCYSRRFVGLRYPLDGRLPSDYGFWRSLLQAGARFASVDRPQSVYYGDNLSSSIRVSVPSLVPPEQFYPYVDDIFRSKIVSNRGRWCERFEREVAKFIGVGTVISAPNADTALIMACAALRLRDPERREVVLPSYTFPSTANALLWNGLDPVFADIDPRTLCISATTVAPLISSNTLAILAVHAHGNPCDMASLEHLAKTRNVALLSDAAAAFGASIGDRRIGSFGDMEVFSFSGTKVLTAGEGGVVSCGNPAFSDAVRCLGRYGLDSGYTCATPGVNGKLAELPAALASCQLPLLAGWQERRLRAVERYHSLLERLDGVRFQEPFSPAARSTWKDCPLILPDPASARFLAARLAAYRIQTRPYYRPLHKMARFAKYATAPLPETDRIADSVVCIPLYTDIRDEVIALVATVISDDWHVRSEAGSLDRLTDPT